ncbi:PAAR-like protein [Lacrimispora amygdalina]|uniref:PAAR-like protein n=1 Tax=Lacrimispora amygdalina TaxID=253257 RepID=UPI000BE25D8D|nr:PAAR-like protein [Lacrimispora amygdalina]
MGWFSWLFGKEKGPPEPLVLGAKLRCPYGSQDSYLYVDSVGIDVNNLPKACVEDCKALHNIGSFGDCYAGGPCEKSMVLDEKWENPEPQGEKINGKEIITTKSLLSCRASGMEFKIINSGQDGIFAKQIILMQEMDEKYPGLREILDNPYGSLYLNEGKYELALQFIEDRMIKNGGKIELYTLYDKNNLEGEYIKGALGRLMPYCDTGALESLLNGMENSASKNKMDANADWDAHVINAEMIKLLKKDCKETKEQIETKPFYKWQEENKLFLSVAAEGVTNFAYGTLMYYSAMGSTGNTQSKGNKPAVKEKNGGSGTKGTGDAVKGGSKIADDIVKQGQKALNNFDINSSYVKPKHLSSSGGKGAKFLGDTKEAAEVILKDAMSSGKVQSIADNGLTKMGQQSYQIVIDAGKEVGTKGETLIKIVISEDGGMLSAYPVK